MVHGFKFIASKTNSWHHLQNISCPCWVASRTLLPVDFLKWEGYKEMLESKWVCLYAMANCFFIQPLHDQMLNIKWVYIRSKCIYIYVYINICLPTFGLNLRYVKVNAFLHGAAYDMGIQTRRLFKMDWCLPVGLRSWFQSTIWTFVLCLKRNVPYEKKHDVISVICLQLWVLKCSRFPW